MVNTYTTNFGVSIMDSNVVFGSGAAYLHGTLVPFDGTSIPFVSMTDATGSDVYQNVLMYLQIPDTTRTGIDMTRSTSSTGVDPAFIKYPVMTNPNGFPLGMFTIYTDGSNISLTSHTSI